MEAINFWRDIDHRVSKRRERRPGSVTTGKKPTQEAIKENDETKGKIDMGPEGG